MARTTTRSTSRRRKRPVDAPVPLDELAAAIPHIDLTGWDDCRPRFCTPIPTGAVFDVDRVVRVIRALAALPHTKGRWAGRAFIPDPWQIVWIIAPIFGWVHADTGHRVFSEVFIEVPRKAGKSTLAARLLVVLLCADGEMGAEVYAAAASRDQAKIVGNDVIKVIASSPRLAKKVKTFPGAARATVPATGGVFRALSKVAETAHGLNVHGSVIDELHVHRTRDLVDAIESGVGAREQPLVITITTADDGRSGTIYEEKHDQTISAAKGIADLSHMWGVIWAAEEGADPFAESTWRSSQPGLGRSVTVDYYRRQAQKAKETPSYLPTFKRLYLNVRTREVTRFLDLERWDTTAGIVTPDMFTGRVAYGGLDLSSTSDLTAAVLLTRGDFPANQPHKDLPDGRYAVWPMFWLPEDRVDDIAERTGMPLRGWVNAGKLRLTEGNVVDYEAVRTDLAAERDRLGVTVVELAYDPWNATETVQELERDGWTMVPVRQGYQSMTAPMKELERLVMGSTPKQPLLLHGGHPVLRWHADSLEAVTDPSGNVKPVKPDRRKSVHRIDGMTALITALARAMTRETAKRSAYEDGDLIVV